MDKMWDDIVHFHNKFNIPRSEFPSVELIDGLMEFRVRFLKEELEELIEAVNLGDRVKAFDALIDLVYVAMGTAYICNFPWKEGWFIVQSANLTKRAVRNESESKRGSRYDIIKPEGWVSPDRELSAIIELYEQRLRRSRIVKET